MAPLSSGSKGDDKRHFIQTPKLGDDLVCCQLVVVGHDQKIQGRRAFGQGAFWKTVQDQSDGHPGLIVHESHRRVRGRLASAVIHKDVDIGLQMPVKSAIHGPSKAMTPYG